MCTSHPHSPANPVEMPFGEEKAPRERQRDRVHLCNVCDKDFKSFPMHNQHIIWQHFGHVFVCKGCGKEFNTNISIHRRKKLLLVGQRTTIKEIILNLNMMGRRKERGWFWPASGREQISSTNFIGNQLFHLKKMSDDFFLFFFNLKFLG